MIDCLNHIPTNFSPTQAQRLFHGRGHAYPGLDYLNIDWLPPVALITLYREVPQDQLNQLARALAAQLPGCRSVQVQHRHRHKAPFECLWGETISQTTALEDDLRYHIRLQGAQNTGLFLDMANGRRWVRTHARDRRALNLFAYTCGFSVAALAGGAARVVNFDMSSASLSTGRDNHRLNQQDTSKVSFEAKEIFRSFGRIRRLGPFDLLICDPPTLQRGSVDIRRDYPKIIRRLAQFMAPGADLLLCLNDPSLGPEFLLDMVATEAPNCRHVETLTPPAVFREAHPGRGLKTVHFRFHP